jgi:hypothetical protein
MSGVLLSLLPEVTLALLFVGYACTGPLLAWRTRTAPPEPGSPGQPAHLEGANHHGDALVPTNGALAAPTSAQAPAPPQTGAA